MTNIVTVGVALGGVLSAFGNYRRNQTLKRQEVLLPLMKEFDTDKNIFYAKELIDIVPVQIKDEKENFIGKYYIRKATESDAVMQFARRLELRVIPTIVISDKVY